jgi:hypothetical protein
MGVKSMRRKLKNLALVFCLFTFLLIVLGGGLRLSPGGAVVASATGTPLLIYAFHRLLARPRELSRGLAEEEMLYDRSESIVHRRA